MSNAQLKGYCQLISIERPKQEKIEEKKVEISEEPAKIINKTVQSREGGVNPEDKIKEEHQRKKVEDLAKELLKKEHKKINYKSQYFKITIGG